MKHVRTFCLFFLFIGMHNVGFSGIKPMGFTRKVVTPEGAFYHYYPKLQIINDTLFVCSNAGVYCKDMLQEGDWELYAFEGAPVIEFVRNGRTLLANTADWKDKQDSLLLLSRDGGKTYTDYTSSYFQKYEGNHLFRLVQNPQNPNSLLTLGSHDGLSRSEDFGQTWQSLYPYSIGCYIACVSYHPTDTAAIFYCGETPIQSGGIYSSYDSGTTWSFYEVPGGDNCVHQIDFHPTDPDMLVFGGEGAIGKSTDKGKTWVVSDLYDTAIYFYKVLFDKENPDILYASGPNGRYRSNNQDTIFVYRSTDAGDTWQLAYKEYLGGNGGDLVDMVKYKDKLIFYTRDSGLWELDVKTTPVAVNRNTASPSGIKVYPNPVSNTLRFETDLKVQWVEIITPAGNMAKKVVCKGKENQIDVSDLETGVYFVVFEADNQRITKKVCIVE